MIFNVLILFGNNKNFYGFVIDSIVSDFEWKRKEGFDGGSMPLLLCDNLYIKLVREILFLSGKVQAFGISCITLLHHSVFFCRLRWTQCKIVYSSTEETSSQQRSNINFTSVKSIP